MLLSFKMDFIELGIFSIIREQMETEKQSNTIGYLFNPANCESVLKTGSLCTCCSLFVCLPFHTFVIVLCLFVMIINLLDLIGANK